MIRYAALRIPPMKELPAAKEVPVDQTACNEIAGRIPAIIAVLGHDGALLFLERLIVAVQQDRENHLCQFLKI